MSDFGGIEFDKFFSLSSQIPGNRTFKAGASDARLRSYDDDPNGKLGIGRRASDAFTLV